VDEKIENSQDSKKKKPIRDFKEDEKDVIEINSKKKIPKHQTTELKDLKPSKSNSHFNEALSISSDEQNTKVDSNTGQLDNAILITLSKEEKPETSNLIKNDLKEKAVETNPVKINEPSEETDKTENLADSSVSSETLKESLA